MKQEHWCSGVVLAAMFLAAAPACSAPKKAQPGSDRVLLAAHGDTKPIPNAACTERTRVFNVDTPLWSSAPDAGFAARLAEALNAQLAENEMSDVFCDPGDRGEDACDAIGRGRMIRASVDMVLPNRSHKGIPKWRRDGHLRFYQVSFHSDALTHHDVRPLSVHENHVCTVLSLIQEASASANRLADDMKVSRRWCAMGVSGPQALAEGRLTTWHKKAISFRPNQDAINQPAWRQATSAVLIDTGLSDDFVRVNGSMESNADIGDTGDQTPHLHGLGMALLLSSLTEYSAAVRSLRVFDNNGSGVSGHLAQALDEAIFEREGPAADKPLLLNMSLGWAPELEHPRTVEGLNKCSTVEASQGEPVRYMLSGARQMDSARQPIMVLGAAGNRPLTHTRPDMFNNRIDDTEGDPCPPPSIKGPHLLYPARWGQYPSCDHRGHEMALITPISGVNAARDPIGLSIPDQETPLVAPAEHVYVTSGGSITLPDNPDIVQDWTGVDLCSVDEADHDTGERVLRLPAVFTGTSVATALVTAAASRLYGHLGVRRDQGDTFDLPSGHVMSRLLYITGEGLCRETGDGTPVRQVSLARAEALVSECDARFLPKIFRCLDEAAGPEVFANRDLIQACSRLIEGLCRIEMTQDRSCEPSEITVDWSDEMTSAHNRCLDGQEVTPPESAPGPDAWLPCEDGVCAGRFDWDRVTLGRLGPQPGGELCPACNGVVATNDRDDSIRFSLDLWLSRAYPEETIITDPKLYVLINGDVHEVDLTHYSHLGDWVPGGQVKIENIESHFDAHLIPDIKGALLSVKMTQSSMTATNYSALSMKPESP
ncbi:MAG: hypothetical protein ACE366_08770 [Bradymonadia bacterium]